MKKFIISIVGKFKEEECLRTYNIDADSSPEALWIWVATFWIQKPNFGIFMYSTIEITEEKKEKKVKTKRKTKKK